MASYTKIPANNKQGYKWICTLEGPQDPVTGKRKQIPRRGDTKKEAYARAQKVLDDLKNHGIDEKKVRKMTFEDVAEDWLKTYSKRKVKRRTVRQRGVQIKVLNRYLAKKNISQITHREYQHIFNHLDDEGYEKNTMDGIHNTGNMIFKYAVLNKLRMDNPAIDTIVPEKTLSVEEIENAVIEEKYLSRKELSEFLKAAIDHGKPQDKEIFYLLAFSGMRSGELCSLNENTDLDFDRNSIRITKTMDSDNMRKYLLTPPKTTGSIRTVSVDPMVMEMLHKHINRMKVLMKEHKLLFPDYHDKGFLFRNNDGYPLNAQAIRDRMYAILKFTDIQKKATPHIFRHTHVSMLAEAGVDLKTIMDRVGHDNEKTTLQIYTHVTEKMRQDADQKIQKHFADILKIDHEPE
ncbi:tyrosine-type recombinase/integrase [Paenibacillus sp. FSL K6-1330]|uniref:tyrosine-type recombinase/integrase n=1 Tax=Paenibacillus sp. FSL K6-1330 TaxID=2975292 RepID=UPI0030DD7763